MIKNPLTPNKFPIPEYLPFSDSVQADAEYFYVCQAWWDGSNFDTVMWWKDLSGTCWYRCVLTGKGLDKAPEREVANRQIPCDKLDDLIGKLRSAGVMEIQSQPKARVISNYDRLVSIRLADGATNTYCIRGGVANDPRANDVSALVYGAAPEFFPGSKGKPLSKGSPYVSRRDRALAQDATTNQKAEQ